VQKLGEFLALHPEVKIETVVTNSPTAILDEGLDVVFVVGELADSTFVARTLGWTMMLTCAAPSYLDLRGRPNHPRELAGHKAIIPGRRDEDSFARWTFIRGAEREEVDVPVAVVARDGIGLVDAGVGGAGVARIYDLSANAYLRTGSLEIILSNWDSGTKPVQAVLPSRRNVPAKVRLFLEFAQSIFPESALHRPVLSAPSKWTVTQPI
jgi:LysR family transcriptional regulator for bpeEF and oprC